jgi:ribulose 1,5-bisphosphate synthetase/thiazole synthase
MARSNGAQGRRHRVAIVGGGFGGLFAARALRRAEVEVTVVGRTNHHRLQPGDGAMAGAHCMSDAVLSVPGGGPWTWGSSAKSLSVITGRAWTGLARDC